MNSRLEKLKGQVEGWTIDQLRIEYDTAILEYQIQPIENNDNYENCLNAVSIIGAELVKRVGRINKLLS